MRIKPKIPNRIIHVLRHILLRVRRKKLLNICAAFPIIILLGGCGTNPKSGFALTDTDQSLQGPIELIHDERFRLIDLVTLLAPDLGGNDLDMAAAIFSRRMGQQPPKQQQMERNEVQDRMIAASNQQCGEYVKFIKKFDSESNLTMGILTTISGGAGAIFKPATTARTFSGLSAVFGGIRAEANDAYFQNLTIQVIAEGIEAKRRETLARIHQNRADKDLSQYGVWRSIGDAIEYHANCSAVAGLRHAALNIKRTRDPGLAHVNNVLDMLGQTTAKLDKAVGVADTGDEAANLPLTAFLVAKDLNDELASFPGMLDMLTNPDPMTLQAPTEPDKVNEPEEDAAQSERDAYQNYLGKKNLHTNLVEDIRFLQSNLCRTTNGKDASTKLSSDISKSVKENSALLTDDEQDKVEVLQSSVQKARARIASRLHQPEKEVELATLDLERAKSTAASARYRKMAEQTESLLQKARRIMTLHTDILQRGAKPGKVISSCPSADNNSASEVKGPSISIHNTAE